RSRARDVRGAHRRGPAGGAAGPGPAPLHARAAGGGARHADRPRCAAGHRARAPGRSGARAAPVRVRRALPARRRALPRRGPAARDERARRPPRILARRRAAAGPDRRACTRQRRHHADRPDHPHQADHPHQRSAGGRVSGLAFESVTVRFGPTAAVDDVTLTVPDGEVLGLVGESGSGKSTLARAAVGLVPVQGGRIVLDGEPIDVRHGRRPLQMVFQDPYSSLDPRMTIGASIAEILPRHLKRAARADEVARLLELVHLDPARAEAYPLQLSGGQRQRVAIARALAGRPEVLIADEITSALDVSIQGSILNLVRELQAELGLSMLFISHNLAVVRYVASRVAVMHRGRIVEEGPALDVLADPQDPYTRELLAAIPGRIPTSTDNQDRKSTRLNS